MPTIDPFTRRPAALVPYHGLIQTSNTCVFASVASACNWLTGSRITEAKIVGDYLTGGGEGASFGNALRHIPTDGLVTAEYHDRDNPLPPFDELWRQLEAGAVLIMSLEGSDHTHATTARAAARSTSSTSANPVDLARQIKALVEQYGAEAVKEMATVFAE